MFKPSNKKDDDDCAFVNDSDGWMRKYKTKYFDEANSTPWKERREEKNVVSSTGVQDKTL